MISLPIWLFIGLIVTNMITALVIVALINLICYIHDMIKVSIDMRKEEKRK